MGKNLKHLTSIHEAASELHKLLQNVPWYINCQVISHPDERGATVDKQERREIVVYVRNLDAVANSVTNFHSWPVRYERGA